MSQQMKNSKYNKKRCSKLGHLNTNFESEVAVNFLVFKYILPC